jgi:hypothetical protein
MRLFSLEREARFIRNRYLVRPSRVAVTLARHYRCVFVRESQVQPSEALTGMTVPAIDERQLPAMYMVWPVNRLPAVSVPVVPSGYVVLQCHEPDLSGVRAVIDADGPIGDRAWESFRGRIVPGGGLPDRRGRQRPACRHGKRLA